MKTRLLLLAAMFLAAVLPLTAADWPQWQGPDRTNVSKETGLLKDWPSEGPKLLWTYDNAGIGFSGPAIVGDRLYTQGARNGTEVLIALNIGKEAKQAWAVEVGPLFVNGWGDGPRGTPTVDGDRVYCLGGQGNLICAEAVPGAEGSQGKKVWQKNMQKDLGGKMMSGWGYTESVLIDGDRLICTPGGSRGTLAALDKKTGSEVWRSTGLTESAAYSSVIIGEAGGIKQYVQMTGGGVAGVAAKDGKLLWKSSVARNGTAIIPTPIYHDGFVYATSGYGAGCGLLKLVPDAEAFKAEEVYVNKIMANHHGGVVLVDGHVYGYSDGKGWVCQDFKTGKDVWAEKKLGKGSITCVDGMLICYSEGDGTVVLIEASPAGWKEHGRFKIPRTTAADRKRGHIWTHPVVADGKLYLRDQELIFCYDVNNN